MTKYLRTVGLGGGGVLIMLSLIGPPDLAMAQAAPSPRASLIAADRTASNSVLHRGLAAGLSDVFADSAVFLYEGAPIIAGRHRVSDLLHAQPALSRLRVQWFPIIVAVSQDGHFGVTSGMTVIGHVTEPVDSALEYGHYISVWRRTADSAWKIIALVENGIADPDSVTLTPGLRAVPAAPPVIGAARAFVDADIAFAHLAVDSGGPAAFGTYAALDATTPPGTGIVTVGATAIRARMQSGALAQAIWEWHPVYAGASSAGDLGFTVGESTITASPAPGADASHGKYLTVWRRQPDGNIRFIMDTGNTRPTP